MKRSVVTLCLMASIAACGSDGPGVDDVIPPSTVVPAGSESKGVTDVTAPIDRSSSTDSTQP